MAEEFDGWLRGESLGEGGQARTYFAYKKDDPQQNPFVLKVLKYKTSPSRLKRFEKEIKVGSRLNHPNIVRIEAENIEHEKPYIVMEYCSGGELQKLDLSQVSMMDKLHIFRAICSAVGHMHSNGVIHRDLKPSNIFLRADARTPVVGDLGLCLLTEQDERLTETTEAVGARLFMAPELEDGRYEDAKPVSDIYALGKILYWLLSDKKIFSREKHKDERFDLRAKQGGAAITFIYHLLDGMIVAEPSGRRYSDANEVVRAMDKITQRIAAGGHALDLSIPQQCTYCREGNYQKILQGNFQRPEWGPQRYHLGIDLMNVPSTWLILACDYCGNIQMFRADLASENPGAWEKGSKP